MTARPIPKRHWRSYGDEPLPTARARPPVCTATTDAGEACDRRRVECATIRERPYGRMTPEAKVWRAREKFEAIRDHAGAATDGPDTLERAMQRLNLIQTMANVGIDEIDGKGGEF